MLDKSEDLNQTQPCTLRRRIVGGLLLVVLVGTMLVGTIVGGSPGSMSTKMMRGTLLEAYETENKATHEGFSKEKPPHVKSINITGARGRHAGPWKLGTSEDPLVCINGLYTLYGQWKEKSDRTSYPVWCTARNSQPDDLSPIFCLYGIDSSGWGGTSPKVTWAIAPGASGIWSFGEGSADDPTEVKSWNGMGIDVSQMKVTYTDADFGPSTPQATKGTCPP